MKRAGREGVEPDAVAKSVGGELDGGEAESKHGFSQDEKSGQSEGGPVGRHPRELAELGEGEGEEFEDQGFERGEGKGKSLQLTSFHISAAKEASVGVTGSARESGTGFSGRGWNFFESFPDGVEGSDPLEGRGGVLGEKSVTDRDATEVEAKDSRVGGTKGVDHLDTAPAEVDMKPRAAGRGKGASGQGDKAALFMASE